MQNHKSALEQRIALYKSDQQQHSVYLQGTPSKDTSWLENREKYADIFPKICWLCMAGKEQGKHVHLFFLTRSHSWVVFFFFVWLFYL